MHKTFEQYLEEDVWEAEGVLDDNLPDAFEAWLAQLDTEEVMNYADEYGNYVVKQTDGYKYDQQFQEVIGLLEEIKEATVPLSPHEL